MAIRNGAFGRWRAFTMIEMLVILALIGVLAGVVSVVTLSARARARAMTCLNNQREISQALVAFYQDSGAFPPDGPNANLALALGRYIPWPSDRHEGALPAVYRCPNDAADATVNSYASYYVRRKALAGPDYFVIGCPRHGDADKTYLNTAGLSGVERGDEGRIRVNGREVPGRADVDDRTIANGEMRFDDNSKVRVVESSSNFRISAIASFREPGGRLYTLVRVEGEGKAAFDVTPGSKFEVVTPVALIGVRGTEFIVNTRPPASWLAGVPSKNETRYTQVSVTRGAVAVWDRLTEKSALLKPSESIEVGPVARDVATACIQCPAHCVGTLHCGLCPRHVLKPENIGGTECVKCEIHTGRPNLKVSSPTVSGKSVYFTVTNPGDRAVSISQVSLSWPGANGYLQFLHLGNILVCNSKVVGDSYVFPLTNPKAVIQPKASLLLWGKFENNALNGPYAVSLNEDPPAGGTSTQAAHCRRFCPLHPDNVLPRSAYSTGANSISAYSANVNAY